MSANEQNDWSDSLDFESLADEHDDFGSQEDPEAVDDEITGDLDGFDETLVDEAADLDAEPEYEAEVDAETESESRRRVPGVSGTGLGVLFAFSILVAAVGSGGALMTALGVDPVSLWQPQGLSQVDQLLNLDRNPLNLVYIVLLATMLLTLLGAWAIARAVGRAGARAGQDAHLVEMIADLRIDDERGWQSHTLKSHPALATFVDENVGAWRLLEARQRRAAGLEGELQRLARAAAADNRDELKGRFDHPAVGTLADELARQLDVRESAQSESDAIRTKDRGESETLVRAVSDVAGWNLSFTDQVGVQSAAAVGLESRLEKMAASLTSADGGDSLEDARQVLTHLRSELREACGSGGEEDVVKELNDLVERETKLAFQIAMEVARLGQRGERLLPMTQTLEELSTSFRKTTERLGGSAEDGPSLHERWERHLASLQDRLDNAGDKRVDDVTRELTELIPLARDLNSRLGSLATDFDNQTDRLRDLGKACAALTGVDFDADNLVPPTSDESEHNDLGLTRFDPFSGEAEDDATLQVDPFATGDQEPADAVASLDPTPDVPSPAPSPLPDPAATPVTDHQTNLDDTQDVVPSQTSQVVPPTPVEPTPVADVVPPAPVEPTPVADVAPPAAVESTPVADVAPPAPAAPAAGSESVYDVGDLGGSRLDAVTPPPKPAPVERAPAEPAEPIYDLSEFGAVRLG